MFIKLKTNKIDNVVFKEVFLKLFDNWPKEEMYLTL